ncbi:MAG: zinc-binding dehydrogenase [Cyanobacteria bacterium P01_D01_bin.1]
MDVIFDPVAAGTYGLPIAGRFGLDRVREAHAEMAPGQHVGKYILQP